MPMEGSKSPRVFISHAWKEKPFARRIARRLAHRGAAVWIDESEMQVGDRLTEALTRAIRESTHLAVVLTRAALASRWVAKELEAARAAELVILPLIAEAHLPASALDEDVGVEVWDALAFEDRMDAVAGAILGAPAPTARDPVRLRRDLDALAREAPELRALIVQLADEGRITHAQLGATVLSEPLRHPAETALIASFELASAEARYVISLVAARFYRQLGVGYPVLRGQIERLSAGSGELGTLFNHLGDRLERPEDLPGAFRLFQLATPPQDQAFAEFVRTNFERFTPAQRDQAVAFMVAPDRGPGGFGVDAAFALFARLPQSRPLHDLWWFWVNEYRFGGKRDVEPAQDTGVFFSWMNDAVRDGLKQFDPIMDHFETCFRATVRSRTLEGVLPAVDVLVAAANGRYVRRARLARLLMQALGSDEWSTVPERAEFFGPLSDLSAAVERDQSVLPAMDALEEALSRTRGSSGRR